MPDEYEDMFDFLDKNEDADAELDQDSDGLSNLEEYRRQTDPEDDDTDDDSLSDGAEVNDHGTNPNSADTDNDGIDDGEELVAGPIPTSPTRCWPTPTWMGTATATK